MFPSRKVGGGGGTGQRYQKISMSGILFITPSAKNLLN